MPNVLQVVWTDEFSTLLTFDNKRIIDDDRIGIDRPYTRDWNLIIHDVKVKDRGRYICQINTQPIKTKPVDLNVLGKLVLSLLRLLHEITNLSILRLDFGGGDLRGGGICIFGNAMVNLVTRLGFLHKVNFCTKYE